MRSRASADYANLEHLKRGPTCKGSILCLSFADDANRVLVERSAATEQLRRRRFSDLAPRVLEGQHLVRGPLRMTEIWA